MSILKKLKETIQNYGEERWAKRQNLLLKQELKNQLRQQENL